MTAAEVGEASGIPEEVLLEKFGLRGKHVAGADEHVSDLAVQARPPAARGARDRSRVDRRRPLLRLDVEGLRGLAGGSLDRAPARLRPRLCGRVRQRLDGNTRRAACGARAARRRAGVADDPSRRGVSRVVPARLRERALALHVQLRRRRRRRAARRRRGAELSPRLARDHRRFLRVAGEGAGRGLGRAAVARDGRVAATTSTSPIRRR